MWSKNYLYIHETPEDDVLTWKHVDILPHLGTDDEVFAIIVINSSIAVNN